MNKLFPPAPPWVIALMASMVPVQACAYTNLGFGNASPTQLLTVGAASSAGNVFYSIGTDTAAVDTALFSYQYICAGNGYGSCNGGGGVVIGPPNTSATVNLTNTGASFFNGGYVGIGTNSPSWKLSVYGVGGTWSAVVTGSYGLVAESNNASYTSLEGYNNISGAYGALGTGNKGVYGTSVAGGWAVIGSPAANSNGVLGYGNVAGNVAVEGYNSATGAYGYLGYSSYGVYCSGSCSGSPWVIASDRRLKRDITTIDGALEKILRLRGVYFRWKDPKKDKSEGQKIGLIAQEVEPVFPELVKEVDLPLPENPSQHGEGANALHGIKVLSYGELVGPIVEGIKELNQKVEKNREDAGSALAFERASAAREQATREERVERLSQEVAQLKDYLCGKDAHAPGCQEPAHE